MWGNSSPFNKGGTYINQKISHPPLKIRFPVSPNHKANSLGLLSGYRPHLYSYWVPWWWLCRWRRMLRVPAPAVMNLLGLVTSWVNFQHEFVLISGRIKLPLVKMAQNYIPIGLCVYTNVLEFQPKENRRGCLLHWVLVGWFLVFFLGAKRLFVLNSHCFMRSSGW